MTSVQKQPPEVFCLYCENRVFQSSIQTLRWIVFRIFSQISTVFDVCQTSEIAGLPKLVNVEYASNYQFKSHHTFRKTIKIVLEVCQTNEIGAI